MARHRKHIVTSEHEQHARLHRDVGRARHRAAREESWRNPILRYLARGDYWTLSKYLSMREIFWYTFYERLGESRVLPEKYKTYVREAMEELARRAYIRALLELFRYRALKYANHPVSVKLDIPYSLLMDLSALARLAFMEKRPWKMPLLAGLTKHLWCVSSRTFIRWDGSRDGKFYLAINIVKMETHSAAPNTGDKDNITLPMLQTWVEKFEDSWTNIIDLLLEKLENMAEDRATITRDSKNSPVHTLPAALAAYTDYPQRIRSIVMGLPEMADTMYHCSLYYMPVSMRPLKQPRKHRIYETKMRRRYRRMEGWL